MHTPRGSGRRLLSSLDVFFAPVPCSAGTLMIEPTESEDKAELDRFANALICASTFSNRVPLLVEGGALNALARNAPSFNGEGPRRLAHTPPPSPRARSHPQGDRRRAGGPRARRGVAAEARAAHGVRHVRTGSWERRRGGATSRAVLPARDIHARRPSHPTPTAAPRTRGTAPTRGPSALSPRRGCASPSSGRRSAAWTTCTATATCSARARLCRRTSSRAAIWTP